VIAAFAGDHFIVEPLIANWKARSAEIADLRQKISQGEALIEHKDALREHWSDMRRRSLPTDGAKAEIEMQTAVGNWTKAASVVVSDIKPRWTENDETGGQLEVRLSASGKLPDLARFLYELEHDPISIRLDDVEIRARDDKGKELLLETRFTASCSISKPRRKSCDAPHPPNPCGDGVINCAAHPRAAAADNDANTSSTGFNAFKLVIERNIFDPNRSPNTPRKKSKKKKRQHPLLSISTCWALLFLLNAASRLSMAFRHHNFQRNPWYDNYAMAHHAD